MRESKYEHYDLPREELLGVLNQAHIYTKQILEAQKKSDTFWREHPLVRLEKSLNEWLASAQKTLEHYRNIPWSDSDLNDFFSNQVAIAAKVRESKKELNKILSGSKEKVGDELTKLLDSFYALYLEKHEKSLGQTVAMTKLTGIGGR